MSEDQSASERPNAGQEHVINLFQLTSELGERAEAAEAKLAETKRQLDVAETVARHTKTHLTHRVERLTQIRDERTRERDLALWLHAEAVWFLEQKQRDIRMLHDQWLGARKTAGNLRRERDEAQRSAKHWQETAGRFQEERNSARRDRAAAEEFMRDASRERDEAQAKLDQVTANRDAYREVYRTFRGQLDQVRSVILDFGQLENKLQPIEVIEKIDAIVDIDNEPEPVTDREEPRRDVEQFIFHRLQDLHAGREVADSDWFSNSADTVRGMAVQLARWLSERGYVTDREEPARGKTVHEDYCGRGDGHDGECEAPDWYPSEESAKRVVTGLAMVDACDRCTGPKDSEEPAGEAKPRVPDSWSVSIEPGHARLVHIGQPGLYLIEWAQDASWAMFTKTDDELSASTSRDTPEAGRG